MSGAALVVAAIYFAIGFFGVVSRRNTVLVLLSIEVMLNASLINLAAWARMGTLTVDATVLGLFVLAVSAAELALGFALAVALYRAFKMSELDVASRMKG